MSAEQQSAHGNSAAPSANAVQWLATGERGISSETIFTVLTGLQLVDEDEMSHPLDGWDFRRCCLLLDSCPELAARFDGMSSVSPEWKVLICSWYSIFAVMNSENPQWRDHAGTLDRTHQNITDVLRDAA
nr:hypothetical protein [Burkholderia gladioli]